MSRPRNNVPTYRRHKQSGQAVVTLTDGLGGRRDVLLGEYGTKASRTEYARVVAEWEASGRTIPQPAEQSDLTIAELIVRYWPHAEQHYRRPDGTPTNEINEMRMSLKPLRVLYGHTAAEDFGPLALKAVREAIISGSYLTEKEKAKRKELRFRLDCCRGVANCRAGRIRRMFRWAVENELVPASVLHGLQAVRGLQRGRSKARETEPVRPVPEAFVRAVLPFALAQVAAMAELQLVTGMRPGELVIIRGIDLDMTGKVWMYRPGSDQVDGAHKTAYRGHQRIVMIGPRGQAILRPWLRLNVQEYLFSPKEAVAYRWATQRKARQSKVQPSQVSRKRRKPKVQAADHYTSGSYAYALRRAIDAANKRAVAEGRPPIPRWHPHQIRHTKATEIRREAGLDAARAVLGHRSPAITEVYAELDVSKAAEVMGRLG